MVVLCGSGGGWTGSGWIGLLSRLGYGLAEEVLCVFRGCDLGLALGSC